MEAIFNFWVYSIPGAGNQNKWVIQYLYFGQFSSKKFQNWASPDADPYQW